MIPRLVHITDRSRRPAGHSLAELARDALDGGLEAVIVREGPTGGPEAPTTHELCAQLEALEPLRARGLRVLVSRRLDLVRGYQLDGVQLAADAIPVAEARAWLGPGAWIGYSAHGGDEARAAERAGADFVTLSPVYSTASKPGAAPRGCAWLARALAGLRIPALALGGITPERAGEVLARGAWGIAAVSALATRDAANAARSFQRIIRESSAA